MKINYINKGNMTIFMYMCLYIIIKKKITLIMRIL